MVLTEDEKAIAKIRCKFSLEYCAPFFWGSSPNIKDGKINNATISLLIYEDKYIGITCYHVFSAYLNDKNSQTLCQIGNSVIEPEKKLLFEDEELDIAVFDLEEYRTDITQEGPTPTSFYRIREDNIFKVSMEDFIMFGGYPEIRTKRENQTELNFGFQSSGGAKIVSLQKTKLACEIIEDSMYISYQEGERAFLDASGTSGGPVFIEKSQGLSTFNFIGIVIGEHKIDDFSVLYVRRFESFMNAIGLS